MKLSERFYKRFGYDLTDEFVSYLNQVDTGYRSELHELNELNFARFDAKLEQRAAELRSEYKQELSALRSEFKQEISELRGDLRTEFHKGQAALETKLIRWMFVFRAGSTLTIMGTMLALLKG